MLCFLPLAFWILLVFSLESPCSAVITVVCALIHEMGHIIFIFRKTGRIRLPEGRLNGFLIRERGTALMSYREEAMLYLSGPLANICTAALSLILSPLIGDYAVFISVISLVTGISSLLPIEGYDGYGALRCILTERCDDVALTRALRSLSFVLTALLGTVALYVMDRIGEGYWIFAVFTVSLITSISKALKTQIAVKKENLGD